MKIKANSKHKQAVDRAVYLSPIRGKMPRAKNIRKFINPEAIATAVAPKKA